MRRLIALAFAVACSCAFAAVSTAHVPRHLKACVMQPPYALDVADIDKTMQWEFEALRQCDSSLDLIVLPEASDRQARVGSREQAIAAAKKYNAPLLAACAETAKRCQATLFVNALDFTPAGELARA